MGKDSNRSLLGLIGSDINKHKVISPNAKIWNIYEGTDARVVTDEKFKYGCVYDPKNKTYYRTLQIAISNLTSNRVAK